MFSIPNGIKAVLFDMDGTLVDTEPVGPRVFEDQLSTHGIVPTDKEKQLFQRIWRREGEVISEEAYLTSLVEQYQIKKNPEDYIEEFYNLYRRGIVEADELPGASELLDKLSEKNYFLALVTSSKLDQVKAVLTFHKWADLFSVIVSDEDITNFKPNAEPYITALDQLGLKADECIVIEDSWSGIIAAKKASIFTIGIKAGNEIAQDLSSANVIVDTLNDIDVPA